MHTDMLAADEKNHARQRRILSHAFSVEALRGQEKLTAEYVDLFIMKIGEVAEENKGVVDLNCWFNYLTFDIIGEMAFGESFQCMATGMHVEKYHYAP
jgi:cytochrome P450